MSQPTNNDNFKTALNFLSIAGKHLQDHFTSIFSSEKYESRNRFILFIITAICLTIFITPVENIHLFGYKEGEVAAYDVRATRDYLITDKVLTDKKQAEAAESAPIIYTLDSSASDNLIKKLQRTAALIASAKNSGRKIDKDSLKGAISKVLGIDITSSEAQALLKIGDYQQFISESGRELSSLYSKGVVADRDLYLTDKSHGIDFIDNNGAPIYRVFDPLPINEARSQILTNMGMSIEDKAARKSLKGLLARILQPNLLYNHEKTQEKSAAAKSSVTPVLIQVKRGEMVVRAGDRINSEQEMKLSYVFSDKPLISKLSIAAGVFGLVLIMLYVPYRFARKNIKKFKHTNKDLFLLSILLIGNFLLLKISIFVSSALGTTFTSVASESYYYIFPFAATAMIARIFINSEVALVYAAICTPIVGLMCDSFVMVFYSLLGSIVGAHGVRHCENRGIIFSAGAKVSVVNLALVLSIQLYNNDIFSIQTIYCLIFAIVSGFISSILVSGALPIIEATLQYTTDIKLLELANFNHPALRDLMIKAPGTYHHSILVGNLVEAAAEAINANPLLARVAAYYHDIGKMSKPQYFIENQQGGENRHDKLSPSMSALILISHVKEGVELAKYYRLGKPLIDIIQQSHGTTLIKYFYKKAQELSPGQIINESDFCYPGPKPQTKEAGLVMLADCVEAASRTLGDATPARIQGMVQKIINFIFIDGQLDECELTLKNLHEIAKSFNQILTGIYHQRIDYPNPAYKDRAAEGNKPDENMDKELSKEVEDRNKIDKSSSGEDIKRLGMSK
ncbi:MAG: HDIG domain-containing protein [Desulfuromonadales bacterium]|nr:HDIG domain-containing protein [Desulfuromonadales bacterium]